MKKYLLLFIMMFMAIALMADSIPLSENLKENDDEIYLVYDVIAHEDMAANIFMGWGGFSLGTGVVMLANGNEYSKGFGVQNIFWGGIETALALWLKNSLDEKKKNDQIKEQAWFKETLQTNFFIDLALMAVGGAMLAWGDDNIKGHGTGIMAQGMFKFCFDGINILMIDNLSERYKEKDDNTKK